MTPDAAIFKSIDRSFKAKVKVGNGHFIEAEGKGDVLIHTPAGNKLVINVLLVPQIDRNLLSIAQLLDKGYIIVFEGKDCKISDPQGFMLMSIKMTNNSSSVYTASTDDSKLWHQRLGHANYKSMSKMITQGLVENFTSSLGKQARQPFPSNQAWRASDKLQLVHIDVCGPMKTESLSGNRYYWIYFLKQKSEVSHVFMKFKAQAEIETGCKLKTVRSDNGAEYTSA
ncbi:Retrovirus-related Pol polyprotein from transposon TNT 1-94 [Gossypium australe]|uniref:Retrovirus-related Pol polyprotein from transposon TNT 1-94 n=1 Tax=Gossypium australe TaxID=47621 RepID=A0A5B6VU20_9ROSI|nr:Retrovirus-related Pol polyprotein from transposon TNT 1-94 [Gossypium australe]